jgi:hypothetical protein
VRDSKKAIIDIDSMGIKDKENVIHKHSDKMESLFLLPFHVFAVRWSVVEEDVLLAEP